MGAGAGAGVVLAKVGAALLIAYAFTLVLYSLVQRPVDRWAGRTAKRLADWLDERDGE